MKKSTVGWLFAVIVLSALFVLSLFLGASGYYFSVNYLNTNSDLIVGDKVSIGIMPNQSNVASYTFDGGYLPNELIPQIVQINALDLNSDVSVRVKAEVFGVADETEVRFITTEHFEQAEDGYYYFDDVLKGGSKITFCNYIEFPKSAHFSSDEKYILSIIVETLETKYNSENIWKNVQQY